VGEAKSLGLHWMEVGMKRHPKLSWIPRNGNCEPDWKLIFIKLLFCARACSGRYQTCVSGSSEKPMRHENPTAEDPSHAPRLLHHFDQIKSRLSPSPAQPLSRYSGRFNSHRVPRPPQTRAASFKRLYPK
jgi:hypothetical protein